MDAGWINQSVKLFIVTAFGEDAWNNIEKLDPGTFGKQWVSSCPFPDSETYRCAAVQQRGLGYTGTLE